MAPTFSLSRQDWSLHRKGPIDQARHQEKIKEAIKANLPDLVAEQSIVASDGRRVLKVPIRTLEMPRFRFDESRRTHAGQGSGNSKVGDVIGQIPQPQGGAGRGSGAGDQEGVDYYEVDVTIDDLESLLFEDFGLPNLQPRKSQEIESEAFRFQEVSRKGILANLDKRRTILENIKRNALAGHPRFKNVTNDDLRFKIWTRDVRRETNAVVIAMRDVSGSMGEFEKAISRSFYFWMVRFLRTRYQNVQMVFITHHTEAKEVDEQAFFSLGESGGTRVSSAYRLAIDLVRQRYQPEEWNIYPFHFSDGDNWGDADNRLCVDLVRQMLDWSSLFGYGEILEGSRGWSSRLMNAFEQVKDPRFVGVVITDKKDVYPALKKFFHKSPAES
ncbi:MAG: sporulation protein YhbH [Chloroflexi bacterium]|nr:sporulation protein YhbH [Chloroflexota bacterium]